MQKKRRKLTRRAIKRRIAVGICVLLLFIVAFTLVLFGRFLYRSVFQKDALCGTWTTDGVTTFSFDGKGSGSLILDVQSYVFTYEVEGTQVSVTFVSDAVSDAVYTFEVSEDSLLLIPEGMQNASGIAFTRTGDDGS